MANRRPDDVLQIESISVEDLACQYGTPLYIYSKEIILHKLNQYREGLQDINHLICFPVKCNSNQAILDILCRRGCGFDVASSGELLRVLQINCCPQKIVFSGVGKSKRELVMGLETRIKCFNVESWQEIDRLEELARNMNAIAPIAVRVNPDIDAKVHPYVATGLKCNKFGIPIEEAVECYARIHSSPYLQAKGIDCHVGSQILDLQPLIEARDCLLNLVDEIHKSGVTLDFIDLGGGIGIPYRDTDSCPNISEWVRTLAIPIGCKDLQVVMEPGRSLLAESGILITKIEYLKNGWTKNFAIVDASMTELIRPALYNSYHRIEEVIIKNELESKVYDVVGPICENSDVLGKERTLKVLQDDYLAIFCAGAYRSSMSSNFSSRNRALEIMVDKKNHYVIRERESEEQIWKRDCLLPEYALM